MTAPAIDGFPARLHEAIAGEPIGAFARRAGVPGRCIYRYLRGLSEPRPATLRRLAAAADVAPDWLIPGQGRVAAAFDADSFAGRLREAIAGEPLGVFARRAGVSVRTVYRYLNTINQPTRPILRRIADAAGVSDAWLLWARS